MSVMDITTRHAEELDAHWINRIILLILKDVDTLPAGMDNLEGCGHFTKGSPIKNSVKGIWALPL